VEESTQSIELIEPSIEDHSVILRLTRINDIILQMKELRREMRTLKASSDLKQLLEKVTCLRCGYEWWPNNPVLHPSNCARCASTAWDRPPTANSRRPGDPPRPWWRGRARKHGPRKIIRVRGKEKSPLETMLEEVRQSGPVTIPPPPDTGLPAPARNISSLAPPPDPQWSGSLSAYLKGNGQDDPPQPETLSSHEPPTPTPTPIVTYIGVEYMESAAQALAEEIKVVETAVAEEERLTAVVDAAIEDIGVPRTDAEREELAKAKEEAWPTTRPD
jgi:predicted Zn-ribbon and HTH transcriptional regulator